MLNNVQPRILIVDDELEITEILADLLSEDYDCQKAGSAEQALVRLQQSQFHLVISDITMPGMSGLGLLKYIKEKFEKPPPIVMMITAFGDDENYTHAMKLGADDFLTKPLNFNHLREKLKMVK